VAVDLLSKLVQKQAMILYMKEDYRARAVNKGVIDHDDLRYLLLCDHLAKHADRTGKKPFDAIAERTELTTAGAIRRFIDIYALIADHYHIVAVEETVDDPRTSFVRRRLDEWL